MVKCYLFSKKTQFEMSLVLRVGKHSLIPGGGGIQGRSQVASMVQEKRDSALNQWACAGTRPAAAPPHCQHRNVAIVPED